MVRGEQRNIGWSNIQQELLEEILRKLTVVDYLKCRRVCRSWRRIVDDAVATKGTCPPAPQLPFLMLLPPNLKINNPATLVDMTQEDTSYTIAPPRTWKHDYVDGVFLVQGWIAFRKFYYQKHQCYDLVWFSNPVSSEEFELPHLPLFSGQDVTDVAVKLVFSSAPNSSDFLVVVCATIFPDDENNRQQYLAFCKVADKSWTLIPTDEDGSTNFNQFVILDWKLYAMQLRRSDFVTVFNLRDSNTITSERLVMLNPNAIRMGVHFEVEDEDGVGDGVYYFTSEVGMTRDGDELLLVIRCTQHVLGSETFCQTKGFRIFKLDMCGPRWIEVDDLGDRVLLIDKIGIQVISSKEINLPGKLTGGNCVFFTTFNKYTREGESGVFSLKDKSLKPLSLHPSSQDHLRCLWFMPSLW